MIRGGDYIGYGSPSKLWLTIMTSNSTHEFPSPVGGVPFPVDFAPSVLFACLYALTAPVALWRHIHPRSRNCVLIRTTLSSIER